MNIIMFVQGIPLSWEGHFQEEEVKLLLPMQTSREPLDDNQFRWGHAPSIIARSRRMAYVVSEPKCAKLVSDRCTQRT